MQTRHSTVADSELSRSSGIRQSKYIHSPSGWALFLGLTLIGVILVFLNIDLHTGVNVFFGGTAVFLIARIFGPFWATAAALLVYSYTVSLWGHPYGVLIFSCEAFFVGALGARQISKNLVVSDVMFWLVAAPIVFWLYWGALGMPPLTAIFIYFKQAINGILCAAIAELVVIGLADRWLKLKFDFGCLQPEGPGLRIRSIVITTSISAVLFPSLLIASAIYKTSFDESVERLSAETALLAAQVELRLRSSRVAVASLMQPLANVSSESSADRKQAIANVRDFVRDTAEETGTLIELHEYGGRQIAASHDKELISANDSVLPDAFMPKSNKPPTTLGAWQSAYWVASVELDSALGAHLLVAKPMREWIQRREHDYIVLLSVLFTIVIASALLFTKISRSLTSPISAIQRVAQEFSTTEAYQDQEAHWPKSRILDLSEVTHHFRALLSSVQDKQEQLQILEQMSSRSAIELAALIDTANAPIFGIDAHGLVNEWNQTAERITGFGKNEVMGRDLVAEFITDDYKVAVREVLDKALRGQQTSNYEFPLYTKTGDRVDVLLNSTTRLDASGTIVGVVGVGQDITELNKVLVEQARVADDLTALIDTANAPIFGIDAHGLVNEWNQTAERITGFGKYEVMGRDLVAEFITDDYKAAVREVLDQALKGQQTSNYEFPLYTKTGDRVDVLLNSTTRRDASGTIVGVVGVGQNITELRQSQAQVIQASKLATLGEMATSVAHELNQPLNVIRMAAGNCRRYVQQSEVPSDYVTSKLDRIEAQTERAAAIIDHMRMFGRKAHEKDQPLDPRASVTDALQLVGEQLRLAGVRVVQNFPDRCNRILGHEIQVEQVILNLITNARDALDECEADDKWISFTIDDTDCEVRIICEDGGPGIPVAAIERVFEPFYTTKPMGKGTGLGLSVSYGIIRDMGGHMHAENTPQGARFTITLPTYLGD